jgi:hypothetical protein
VYCNASDDFKLDDAEVDDFSGSCWTKTIRKSGMQLLGTVKHDETWGSCCPVLDGTVSVHNIRSLFIVCTSHMGLPKFWKFKKIEGKN